MRIIGIRHRVKMTAEGEPRPTEVVILDPENGELIARYGLPDDDAEYDWGQGFFPTKRRKPTPEDDLNNFRQHHVDWRELKKDEGPDDFPPSLLQQEGGKWFVATKVPSEFDGLTAGDNIAMVLGGSGDPLAYAISSRAERLGNGTGLFRLPPFILKEKRGGRTKEDDALTLAERLRTDIGIFFWTGPRDRDLIHLTLAFRARMDAMKARIGCEQRLRQRVIGQVFLADDELVPGGSVMAHYHEVEANDQVLLALLAEESRREKELTRTVQGLEVYQRIFAPIAGVGPMIATRLIVAIGDIRRFSSEAKLKAFLGAHVLEDGRFPRRRSGAVANWHPDGRQALYLVGDQFNRRPDSKWGTYLRKMKANLRERHPEPLAITENGRSARRYTDAHIHRMGTWRTLSRFVECIYTGWWTIEREKQRQEAATANLQAIFKR